MRTSWYVTVCDGCDVSSHVIRTMSFTNEADARRWVFDHVAVARIERDVTAQTYACFLGGSRMR